jgi:hypothetical protein
MWRSLAGKPLLAHRGLGLVACVCIVAIALGISAAFYVHRWSLAAARRLPLSGANSVDAGNFYSSHEIPKRISLAFSNTRSQTLRVSNITAGCGCISLLTKISQPVQLSPGQTLDVLCDVTPQRMSVGAHSYPVTLWSDDVVVGQSQIAYSFSRGVDISPNAVVKTIDPTSHSADRDDFSLIISAIGSERPITDVECVAWPVGLMSQPHVICNADSSRIVQLRFAESLGPGEHHDVIKLLVRHTKSETGRVLEVPVAVHVSRCVDVEPPAIVIRQEEGVSGRWMRCLFMRCKSGLTPSVSSEPDVVAQLRRLDQNGSSWAIDLSGPLSDVACSRHVVVEVRAATGIVDHFEVPVVIQGK